MSLLISSKALGYGIVKRVMGILFLDFRFWFLPSWFTSSHPGSWQIRCVLWSLAFLPWSQLCQPFGNLTCCKQSDDSFCSAALFQETLEDPSRINSRQPLLWRSTRDTRQGDQTTKQSSMYTQWLTNRCEGLLGFTPYICGVFRLQWSASLFTWPPRWNIHMSHSNFI